MAKAKYIHTPSKGQGLAGYLLPMLLSAAFGALITWLIMSQRETSSQVRPIPFVTPSAPSAVARNTTAPASSDVSDLSTTDGAVVRGNLAYDHQQWTEAIKEYQEAIAAGRDNPDVRTDLGNAFRFSGQPEKALEQYTVAQRQNPQHENSLFNQIGLFMEVMHDPIRAIPVCEEFIRRFPNSEKVPRVKEQLAVARNL
jgi:tetratricopeptide (TPR) repeat protein